MNRTKTVILVVLSACAAAAAGLGFFSDSTWHVQKTFVIGGANGPTSVFLAGRLGSQDVFFTAAAGFAVAAAGYYLIHRKKRK